MNAQIKPLRFMIAWFIAGLIVLPLAIVLSLTAIVAFQTALSALLDTSSWDFWEDYGFLFMGTALLITGFCIGTLQKGLIRRHAGLEIRRLSLFTALGALLAGIVVSHLPELVFSYYVPRKYDLIPTFMFGLQLAVLGCVLPTAQTLALRRYFRATWLWIAAHLAATALACLIVLAGHIVFPAPYDGGGIQLYIAVPLLSFFTGIVILRFCRSYIRADKSKRGELAAQPIAVSVDPPPKSSVWDDAL